MNNCFIKITFRSIINHVNKVSFQHRSVEVVKKNFIFIENPCDTLSRLSKDTATVHGGSRN